VDLGRLQVLLWWKSRGGGARGDGEHESGSVWGDATLGFLGCGLSTTNLEDRIVGAVKSFRGIGSAKTLYDWLDRNMILYNK
jgi:hypothetical protein